MPRQLSPARQKQLKDARDAARLERERQAAEEEAYDEWLVGAKTRHAQLESVAEGLYEELDKLSKKWPSMAVTQATVTKTNRLLGAIRQLLERDDDDFADALEEIVPAGDLPELRDVVMTLREVKDALDRFEGRHLAEWRRIERESGSW